MTIGDTIKQERERLGFSARKFAIALGVSNTLVSMWEDGTTKPNFFQLYYIFQHTNEGWIRDVCGKLMALLRPGAWPEQYQNTTKTTELLVPHAGDNQEITVPHAGDTCLDNVPAGDTLQGE